MKTFLIILAISTGLVLFVKFSETPAQRANDDAMRNNPVAMAAETDALFVSRTDLVKRALAAQDECALGDKNGCNDEMSLEMALASKGLCPTVDLNTGHYVSWNLCAASPVTTAAIQAAKPEAETFPAPHQAAPSAVVPVRADGNPVPASPPPSNFVPEPTEPGPPPDRWNGTDHWAAEQAKRSQPTNAPPNGQAPF
jgi:hypothetical protein